MEVWQFVKDYVIYCEEEPHRIKEQDNRSLPGDPHKLWDMAQLLTLLY